MEEEGGRVVGRKKIAIFLGDCFWSSTPYDGIPLYNFLKNHYSVDFLMFESDIRLNKVFNSSEKFNFDTKKFKNLSNLKKIKNWDDLYNASLNYSLIITSSRIAPKTRFPFKSKKSRSLIECPIAVWDIGGADILTDAVQFADYFFVKGPIWKKWMIKMGYDEKTIFITGSPHYDKYLEEYETHAIEKVLNRQQFNEKYDLKYEKRILLAPSNPASHTKQFNESMNSLETMVRLCEKNNIELLLKTYPHDYIFYDNEIPYSGIYKRKYTNKPQYQYIADMFPTIKIVESQDHFAAVKHVDKIYNMAGSSIAWETFFTNSVSYSTNFKKQKYYKKLSYLPEYIEFPDEEMNIHVDNCEQIIKGVYNINKDLCSNFILKEISIFNIFEAVKQILNGH